MLFSKIGYMLKKQWMKSLLIYYFHCKARNLKLPRALLNLIPKLLRKGSTIEFYHSTHPICSVQEYKF